MSAWGTKAYENDSAADWFGDLWDEFAVPAKVEATLNLDIEDCHEEIRAAAHLLVQLGDTYRWPVDDIDRHCSLAAKRLEEILSAGIFEEDETDFIEEIKAEIEILRSRVSPKYKED
jgi:hypothetical protein